ncbi:LTA synthase family protein [Bifidobacterium animalis]|uniref:LTA synthase family protein n=1 Tax=Bifidobacterium animalis TaxID=28025 RepID=UPI00080CBA58|nr:LTA synthase family protein [Bifidobacterium animalis]ANU43242.1 phosphoglycerol transferase [Bifidobacterium animalis subsp. animalis]PHQ53845.1 phosphoglycerol transferase [Bifidobacterium animalis subsp. animalis]QQQ90887.1 LTA synthase family protein [Bifidobacterium animalis]UQE64104.1 LTA synthase family protein [Bifidobacterium animalis]
MGTKPAKQASRTRTQRIRHAKRRRMAAQMRYRNHLAAMTATNTVLLTAAHSSAHPESSPLDNVADASQTTAAANTQTAPKRQSAPDESAESNNAEPESVPAKTKRAKKARQAATSHDVQEARKAREQRPPRNPITRQWRRFKETKFYQVWDRRPKFSYGFYTVVFFAMVIIAAMFLWWSMHVDVKFHSHSEWNFFQQVTGEAYRHLSEASCYLNMIGLALIYALLVTCINRFWVGTALFGTLVMVFSVATRIKVTMRNEPVIPSDLGILTGNGGGGAGEVASFITEESQPLVNAAVTWLIWFAAICIMLQFLDRRREFIYCSWRHPIASVKNIFGLLCRIAAPVVILSLILGYVNTLSDANSPSQKTIREIGYAPKLWNLQEDALQNGSLTTFLSLSRVKAMAPEPDYSRERMAQINSRYKKVADEINATRTGNLTDNTVIMVLSESFSDPTRVPNVQFDTDPMSNIRSLKSTTTSGLMLSPGYGGGTANIEFQQMTGLSLTNFSDSLLVPYQQLVASRPQFYSFNQIWNQQCGETYSTSCSVGFHPFTQTFYLRNVNYKKFGFSHLYTRDSRPAIKYGTEYRGPNGQVANTSDEEAYRNVVEEVRSRSEANKPAQYIQLITMQNHSPYNDIYGDANEFRFANKTEGVPEEEAHTIAIYAKGVQRTDQATADFLTQLDQIDKPITVVFYGDHLPGIYNTANSNKQNALTLHETDYFIWSNKASGSHDRKLPETNSAYSSSNYFMAQAADQMNARVSPYLALLDELHKEIPAMSRSVNNPAWRSYKGVTYLNDRGEEINPEKLSPKAEQLLEDYKMVQYDISVGKNYLFDAGFMDVPQK